MRGMTHIRYVTPDDRAAWLQMRCDLWPEGEAVDHAAEIDRFFDGRLREPLAVLIALSESGDAVGFAELSIRRYAEDCETDRVAYLEGWYVVPGARRQGVGRALVEAAFGWGAERGCVEFASDALLDNDASAAAHGALGFEETVRIRCFKNVLHPDERTAPAVPLIARADGIVIRSATISDSDELARLVSELGYPTSPAQMHGRLEAILADADYSTLVALIDAQIAGFIGVAVHPSYEADGLYGQIMALVVASAHRRRGIGKALVASAETLLTRRGVQVVVVTTGNHRAEAHAFYEKSGYVFTGRRYRKVLT
jgi:aminoglycoside 6'-N-acetyltransferase I